MKMVINIYLLMAILSFNSCDENTASPYVPPQEEHDSIPATTEHLTTRSTIADVLAHPAFEGFSQYILPLEWGYDEDMPLSDVERLLPYHNYIDAAWDVRMPGCSFSVAGRAHRLRSSVPEADSRMSALSTRDFRTLWL